MDMISIGVSEAAMSSCGGDDIPTAVETRSHTKRRPVLLYQRLVPLAGSAPVPLVSARRDSSRELLEEAFNIRMYHFTGGKICGIPRLLLIL